MDTVGVRIFVVAGRPRYRRTSQSAVGAGRAHRLRRVLQDIVNLFRRGRLR